MRFCSYCPEDINTAEVKECVESMIKKIYALQAEIDSLTEQLDNIKEAYKEKTGEDYEGKNT